MRFVKWALPGAAVLSIGVTMAAQGTRTQEPDVLAALLVEVRGLRAAMEQMAAAGPRVQLALGRLQLQEQRLNTMLRRLESVRDSLSGAERDAATVQDEARRAEAAAKDYTGPEAQELANNAQSWKRKAAAATAEVQRLQAEEAVLQQQIATEQGRWSDINRQLEDLERALGRL